MKPSRCDTFGENFNFAVSFLACLLGFVFFFFHRYALWNAYKPFFLFSFYYAVYIFFFFFSFLPMLKQSHFSILFLIPSWRQQ